ncbi:MAG: hypothetical protein QOI50_2610 [Pseudonocardiales bacterium]|jgi:hypothetical protein|nr:hypothetical protein [Pseudonocardiales bacterium]MDT7663083.1 hypothetical protein [Pseudonocardiales bacterium]
MNRARKVATAAVIVVAGLFALLFTSGVASASDHSSGDGHSRSNEHRSHSGDRDSRSDDDTPSDDDKDKGGLEVAGIDLSQVTDAVSDLLSSLSGIL